jgi:long-chain acyl-CoA synthetase
VKSVKPWLQHYDAGVPHSLAPYPETTLVDYLAQAAAERPHHVALLFKGSPVSYGELDRWSDAFAAALRTLGVNRGDRVALLLPNCPQFLIAEFGVWKCGAVVVPLNPIYTEAELQRPLQATGAQTVVVLTPFYQRIKQVQGQTQVRRVIATNVKEYLPPLMKLLFTLFKERKEGHRVTLQPGDHSLADLLHAHAGAGKPMAPAAPGDPALILLSGGTTGAPKGVVGLHRNLVATALQVKAWYGPLAQDWHEMILLPLPLFHAFGCVGAQSYAIVTRGTLALVPNPRDLDDLLSTLRQVRPTIFVGVPTLFIAILNHKWVREGKVDFRSIKLCLSGAAALMSETKRRFEELTGGRIVEAYSLSEALLAVIANPVHGGNKPGSVGMPVSDVEVRIAHGETGEGELPRGEVGEILIRAPQLMQGYWNDPAETALTLRDHRDGGGVWLHTGDLGYMDEQGYIFIVDRKKDLIKPGGMQVWPREVEEAVASHPSVAEVGVAGVMDPARGEQVKAWVVLRSGMAATEPEIRAWCKERLAPYKVPALVEFRKDLPKTMIGKVLRRALVAEHRAAAGA